MRAIKFRAWHQKLKKWLDPYIVSIDGLGNIDVGGAETNQVIIGLFTGLTDKNGIEIFEGDIIKVQDYNGNWSRDGAEVVFSNDYVGGWVISNGNQNLNLGTRQIYLEIIGNIYENPELLNSSSMDVV